MVQPTNIQAVLTDMHVIAVVGLSSKPSRPSHGVAQYMQAHGYRIIPVNPSYAGTTILGEPCYRSLTDASDALAVEGVSIEIVDCFRKSSAIQALAEEAIAIGARCLWLQLGVINDEAVQLARAAGMDTVVDKCIKIEHLSIN